MKKLFISAFVVFFIGFISFYFFASQSMLDPTMYYQTKIYDNKANDIPDTLSVMTFNIGYLSGMTNNLAVVRGEGLFEENLEKATTLLSDIKPNMVGMQEIDFGSARSYEYNQLDELAGRAGYPFAYQSINWDKRYVPFPYWPIKDHFGKVLSGQAICSQFPISNDTTVMLMKPVNSSFLYNKFYLDRLIQVCDVQVGHRKIKLMNLHLEAFDEETRVLQAKVVKNIFDLYAEDMPVLLIGDFNSRPAIEDMGEKAMKVIMQAEHIAAAIADSLYAASPASYYTFNSSEPYQRIDYILYNQNYIENLGARVVKEAGQISDHLPVLMKFTLKLENAKK